MWWVSINVNSDPLLYQQLCAPTSSGGHWSLLTPYIPEIGVSNWVPHLWKAVDLWEGACMEASVNFQNVAGCDSSNLTSSQCPLECFLVRSRSDLSSLVSGTSSSFLYLCPSPLDLKQNIPHCLPHMWICMCSTSVRASPSMAWSEHQEIVFNTWKMKKEKKVIPPCLLMESYKICVWGMLCVCLFWSNTYRSFKWLPSKVIKGFSNTL